MADSGYYWRSMTRRLQRESVQRVSEVYAAALAGRISFEDGIRVQAGIIAAAQRRAVTLNDVMLSAELTERLGRGVPLAGVGWSESAQDQAGRLQRALRSVHRAEVGYVEGAPADQREALMRRSVGSRLQRLAGAETVEASQYGRQTGLQVWGDRGVIQGWTRRVSGGACEFCRTLGGANPAANVHPVWHRMPTHPGCTCSQAFVEQVQPWQSWQGTREDLRRVQAVPKRLQPGSGQLDLFGGPTASAKPAPKPAPKPAKPFIDRSDAAVAPGGQAESRAARAYFREAQWDLDGARAAMARWSLDAERAALAAAKPGEAVGVRMVFRRGRESAGKRLRRAERSVNRANEYIRSLNHDKLVARTSGMLGKRRAGGFDQTAAAVGTNPRWGRSGYNTNCTRCTVAYELRRRGFDVSAARVGAPQLRTETFEAIADKFRTREGGVRLFTRMMGRAELDEYLGAQPSGARFIVEGQRLGGAGHVWNAEVMPRPAGMPDGVVWPRYVMVEGQTGAGIISSETRLGQYLSFRVLRVDDLVPTEEVGLWLEAAKV